MNNDRRELSRRILQYEDLLNLLAQLGGFLRAGTAEIEVVRSAAGALGQLLAPHSFAFYFSAEADDRKGLPLVWPGGAPNIPGILTMPEGMGPDEASWLALPDGRRVFAVPHCPQMGHWWALVLVPAQDAVVDSLHTLGLCLFSDGLVGISVAQVSAKANALRSSLCRLLDEHRVILSERIARVAEAKRRAQEALLDFQRRAESGGQGTREDSAALSAELEQTLRQIGNELADLDQAAKGIRPDFVGVRSDFERSYLVPLCYVIPGASAEVQIRTKPTLLRDALDYLRGFLRELAQGRDPVTALPYGPPGIVTIALSAQLDALGREFLNLVADPVRYVELRPGGTALLAVFGVMEQLAQPDVGVTVKVVDDGLRLEIPVAGR